MGISKSNILETLANIFTIWTVCMIIYHKGFLVSEENPKGFDNQVCLVDAFELE